MNQTVTPENFHEIVREYSGYVYTISFRMLGSTTDAEDATQETFLKAYRGIKKFDKTKGLKNWLCTIALNTARDFWRKASRRPQGNEEECGDIPDRNEPLSEIGDQIDIQRMLSVLDIPYRSIMILYYMEQYTTREIATMLKKSQSDVKISLFRARKILLDKFGELVV